MVTKHSNAVPERFYAEPSDSYAVPGHFYAVRNYFRAATRRSDVAPEPFCVATSYFCMATTAIDVLRRELRRRPLRTDGVTLPGRDRPPLSPHFTAH